MKRFDCMCAVALIVVSGPCTLNAAMLSVQSSTDSNGLYSYTVTRGLDSYLWGGGSNMLSIVIPTLGLVATYDPPGWVSASNLPDSVVWRYTGTDTWVVENGPVTFSLRSSYPEPALYDGTAGSGMYQRGMVLGEVYTTNRALYQSVSSNDVTSVNVVGYERFALLGPAVPEPCALLALLLLLNRRRAA